MKTNTKYSEGMESERPVSGRENGQDEWQRKKDSFTVETLFELHVNVKLCVLLN